MPGPTACIWRSPYTTCQLLQVLPAWNGSGYPFSITPDGTSVFGTAQLTADNSWVAVRWNTTTLAATQLFKITTSPQDLAAIGSSANGSVIVGGVMASGPGNIATPLAAWSGGGTSGALLPVGGGSTGPSSYQWGATGLQIQPFQPCSSDGSIVIGRDGTPFVASQWTNGVLSELPSLGNTGGDFAARPYCVSSDGSTVFGTAGQHAASTSNPVPAAFWQSGALHELVTPTEATSGATGIGEVNAFFCNSDLSTVWGNTSIWVPYAGTKVLYWDGPSYTTYHIMSDLPNTFAGSDKSIVLWVATNAGSKVAVGQSPVGGSGAGNDHACKWTGTTATDLGALGSVPVNNFSAAVGCSSDGSVICGNSIDDSGVTRPVRWDSSNVLHVLPSLSDPSDLFQGQALGASASGLVLYGLTDFTSIPPPAAAVAPTGSCGAPTYFSVTFQWSPDPANPSPDSYTLEYRQLGASVWTVITGITDTDYTVAASQGETFEWQVQAVYGGTPTAFSTVYDCTASIQFSLAQQGVLGDYRNGNLYVFNPENLTDSGVQRRWLRSWRALEQPREQTTRFSRLRVDLESGTVLTPSGTNPHCVLRWSDDGGHTWSNERIRTMGRTGETAAPVKFSRLGSTRRFSRHDRVFELSGSDLAKVAITGADVDVS